MPLTCAFTGGGMMPRSITIGGVMVTAVSIRAWTSQVAEALVPFRPHSPSRLMSSHCPASPLGATSEPCD